MFSPCSLSLPLLSIPPPAFENSILYFFSVFPQGSQFPSQGSNLCPCQWKQGVLAPGKSFQCLFDSNCNLQFVHAKSLQSRPILCMPGRCSHVRFCAALWTVALQPSLTLGFPRQEYWRGLPFSSPGELPDLGIKPMFPCLTGGFLPVEPLGKPNT